MIGSYMEYGALSAKVRAMYGKRLRRSDFEHMSTMTSMLDIFEFLRGHPGWSAALAPLSAATGYVGRIELEEALRGQLRREYESLSHFLPRNDKALVSFPVRLTELQDILMALRRLKADGRAKEPGQLTTLPDARVDRAALRLCTDYDGVIAAARGSIYYDSLLHLRSDAAGGLPDYTTAEALLHSTYFSHMYRLIHKNYAGQTQKVLLHAFGEQVDLLNLTHLLRLKAYFPGDDRYYSALFPFHYKLKQDQWKALCDAKDAGEVFFLLRDTPYVKEFEAQEFTAAALERYYRRSFYTFNKRQLVTGEPSVYTALAYLNLKELEFQALVNLVESVKYGVRYDDTFARMVGD